MTVEIAEQKKGNFETPEQLAQALDAKNKALADKIREFGKKQITGESQDWRESLREELSASEEREIRDAIDDHKIDATFNEGMTDEEKNSAQINTALAAVAPWAVPLLNSGKKIEWFFQNFSKSWDKAGDLWNQWEYIEAIKVFFLGLIGKFIDIDTTHQEDHKNAEIEQQKETILTKDFANKFFIDYSFDKKEKKDEAKVLTLTDSFQNLTFQEMKEMKSSDEKMLAFLEKIYKEDAKNQLSLLKLTLNTILEGKWYHLLESIHKEKLPNLTYGVAIIPIKDQLWIFGRLNETAQTNAFGLVDEMKNIFSENDPLNEEKRTKLWLNTEIFSYISSTNRDISNPEKLKKSYWVDKLESKDKEKVNEIIDFGVNIQNLILNDPRVNLGMGNEIKQAFWGKPLTMIEALSLYTMLGWKTNFNEMNDIEQSLLILWVNKLLDGWRGDIEQGKYLFNIASAIKNKIEWKASEIEIPAWVTNFFSSLWNSLSSFAIKYVEDISKTGAWFLKQSPELMWITALIILLYPMAQRNTLLWLLLPDFKKKLA